GVRPVADRVGADVADVGFDERQHARRLWRRSDRADRRSLVAQDYRLDVDLELAAALVHLARDLGFTARLLHRLDRAADDHFLAADLRPVAQSGGDAR